MVRQVRHGPALQVISYSQQSNGYITGLLYAQGNELFLIDFYGLFLLGNL
jgi:hypothetical protein